MKWVASIALLLLATDAPAQTPAGKRYFCVDEFTGGLAFDEQLKRWKSTTFRPSGRFVLSVSPMGADGKSDRGSRYEVSIADSGSDYRIPCFNLFSKDRIPRLNTIGEMRCYSNLQDYVFNFNTMRYLRTYQHGYVDGTENNDNTPSIAGGVCTLIE